MQDKSNFLLESIRIGPTTITSLSLSFNKCTSRITLMEDSVHLPGTHIYSKI